MSATETLCCCEYENMNGERSHILASCCDCEAFDHACDRLVTCRPVQAESVQRLWSTVSDRCRIPWCSGKGAVNVKLDVVLPVIMVPSLLSFATLGFQMTIAVLLFMPIFILVFYSIWRKHGNKRTPFFFIWGLISVLFSLLIFSSCVVPYREILLWELILLYSAMLLMFYTLFNTKKQPGYLSRMKKSQNKELKYRPVKYRPVGGNVEAGTSLKMEQQFVEISSANTEIDIDRVIQEENVYWVDSRPIEDGKLMTSCKKCKAYRPPRAGHCNICDECIPVRDHHCVWIDHCIGVNNHRSFLATMVLFIFCGFYGAHLTLTTICTPSMVLDWVLLPTDCRWLYIDFQNSICFVTTCYSISSSCIMCLALFHQLILISQNLTSQELYTASVRGWTTCCFYAKNNLHNQGILRNWIEFLFYRNRRISSKIPL